MSQTQSSQGAELKIVWTCICPNLMAIRNCQKPVSLLVALKKRGLVNLVGFIRFIYPPESIKVRFKQAYILLVLYTYT